MYSLRMNFFWEAGKKLLSVTMMPHSGISLAQSLFLSLAFGIRHLN